MNLNFTPYPYQVQAIDKLLEWAITDDKTHVNTFVSLIQSGKTFCACACVGELYRQGKRVWIVVDREELLEQWYDSFFELNPDIPKSECWFIGDGKQPIYRKQIQFVQVQTLARRFKDIQDKIQFAPDVMFVDEAHTVGFHRVMDEVTNFYNPKQINITATPVLHGKSDQQYIDKFPLWQFPNEKNKLKGTGDRHWYIGANSKMMLDLKRWKNPNWIVASEELSDITADRFKGVRISADKDYNPTDQASVMIDLLPMHIEEWKINGGQKRSTIWYCVNKVHCVETIKALQTEGRKVALVLSKLDKVTETLLNSLGVITNRKAAIKAFKLGEITDLVNCQCLTTGFSASIASCIVWLRRTMSVGLFCQMSGRALTYHPDWDYALLMDFAGNLGVHGVFPENIDWLDFNPSKKMFRDPNKVVCKSCKYRHDGNPKPQHQTDRKIKFNTGLMEYIYPEPCQISYSDEVDVSLTEELKCEKCNKLVYFNDYKFNFYAKWLKDVKSAVMSGEKPPKFKGDSCGISIGLATESMSQPLTVGDMYDSGIWSLIIPEIKTDDEDGETSKKPTDKSETWIKTYRKQLEALESKSLRLKKLSKLTLAQRTFVESTDISQILKLTDTEGKYRAALGYMYLSDNSPLKSFSYWQGSTPNPPVNVVRQTLENIYNNDVENYELLRSWIRKHLEAQNDHAKRGVIMGMMKQLVSLKN